MNELRQIREQLSSLRYSLLTCSEELKLSVQQEISKLEQKVDLLHEKLDLDED